MVLFSILHYIRFCFAGVSRGPKYVRLKSLRRIGAQTLRIRTDYDLRRLVESTLF